MKLTNQTIRFLGLVSLAVLSAPAVANVVFFSDAVFVWYFWVITLPLTLTIEAGAIWWFFGFNVKRAIIASITVNTLSAFFGGIALTTRALTQTALLFEPIAALLSTVIELVGLRLAFKARVTWRTGVGYMLVNLLTGFLVLSPYHITVTLPDAYPLAYYKARLYLSANPTQILVAAADSGHVDVMEMAMERGADINTEQTSSSDPLLIHILVSKVRSGRFISRWATDEDWRRLKGQQDAFQWLIKNGADVNATQKGTGRSALAVAKDLEDPIGYRLLKEAGATE